MRFSTILLAAIATTATAEPVVAILPEQTFDVNLQDVDSALPNARVYSMLTHAGINEDYLYLGLVRLDENGDEVFPVTQQFDGVDNGNATLGYWNAGLTLPAAADPADWKLASGWFDQYPINFTPLVNMCIACSGCSEFFGCGYPDGVHLFFPNGFIDGNRFEVHERGDVLYLPLREYTDTPGSYHYGWIAFRVLDYVDTVCSQQPDCDGLFYANDLWPITEILAVGFETTPDTPITVGGGACIADLNYDAVLDLSDINAFINGFLALSPESDLNGDGIYDLADISAFVTGFNDCDLL